MKEPRPLSPVRRATANYALAVLFTVYVFNFVDRYLLSVLLQPIKEELQVSDTAMGFLTGIAFALFYTGAGIPIARWSDRGERRTIIALGLIVWSGMTAVSGLVVNFWQLALARIGVGVGEASASPAAHSMISDLFPPERRGRAIGIYTMGANVGILIGAALGGWLGANYGWRVAFFAVGLPGLAMAAVVRFSVAEPQRGLADGIVATDDMPTVKEAVSTLGRLVSFRHLSFAAGFYAVAGYGFLTWGPAFLMRVHGMAIDDVGLYFGIVAGVGGGIGAFLGGWLSDRLQTRDVRWAMWVPAIGGVLSLPFAFVFLFAEETPVALAGYFFALVFGALYISPTYAMTQGLASLRMRALAAAIILFALNLMGMGLGPQLVGILNDALDARLGPTAIRYSMAVVWSANLIAVFHSLRAATSLEADLQARRAADA
jgi:predicted MFS family arabinose efflux permease